ncbi:MAG: hypothetical protein FVQ84_22405 [Planctomycetes bacterium]|nr:hypothetical protein [Planctomycetota bacterium]
MAEETSKETETEEKHELKFSQDQYDMLKRCSEKKDMTEWNEWRKNAQWDYLRNEDIYLEGADFSECYLKGALLSTGTTVGIRGKVYLKKAVFVDAHLEGSHLSFAHLEGANLNDAHLENAKLYNAYLQGAHLNRAHLENTNLRFVHLEDANLWFAHLEGADLTGESHLQGANFLAAMVNHATLIWKSEVNRYCKNERYTDFSAVNLDNARVHPRTKHLLEYNIRRKNWEEWYKEHPRLTWLVKLFWWISDYGLSTKRIIFTFFGLAFIFANIYYHWGRIAPPGLVGNLFIDRTSVVIPWQLVPLRALYFSIVTMTTLGFGDMYAYPTSWIGHILLMVQVILGYVLLGALITRFAVLFTAGGPAGKFAGESKRDSGASKKCQKENH